MTKDYTLMNELGEKINQEKNIIGEIGSFLNYIKNSESPRERKMIESQLNPLISQLKKSGEDVINYSEKISLAKPLNQNSSSESGDSSKNGNSVNSEEDNQEPSFDINQEPLMPGKNPQGQQGNQNSLQNTQQNTNQNENSPKSNVSEEKKIPEGPTIIEKLSLKRMKEKDEKKVKKDGGKKPSKYVKMSSRLFYDFSMSLLKKDMFRRLKRDLIKGNVEFVPGAYISVIFFSTMLSAIAAVFITLFLLFFSLTVSPPFITGVEESIGARFLKTFWLLFALPIAAFLFTYNYPSMERKSLERKINYELPFATIHMSAISNSMIEPSKIFGILVSTGEYPNLSKEFIKLQNEINIYGYDLVTALRHRSYNSPSKKLSELFNGLATTITSGGDLPVFFDKRSQSLLFEHRLDMEKQGKAAETFMDIYISVVIAAPMVLMLLLMMMSISGLGVTLSPSTISLMMILIVSLINILFLSFLHLRQPDK